MLELRSRAPAPPGALGSWAPAGAGPRSCVGNAGTSAPVRVHVRGPGLPLGARDSGAELVLAFGQVSRAPSLSVLSPGHPGAIPGRQGPGSRRCGIVYGEQAFAEQMKGHL